VIPVYQDRFGFGQGNCAWACLASIFERPIEDFHDRGIAYFEEICAWTKAEYPFLRYNERDLGFNWRMEGEYAVHPEWGTQRHAYDIPDTFEPPVEGYWKATIFSPGLTRPEDDPYYPMPGLHAVVFKGDELVHDPNPNYALGSYEPRVVRLGWWTF
jgi:hypothetical protein